MSEERFQELNDLSVLYSVAESKRRHLHEFRKSKKAILMKEYEKTNPKSSGKAQEREAYAHPEYLELLEGLKYATEEALLVKYKMDIIQMRFDAWRSKESTRRAEIGLR